MACTRRVGFDLSAATRKAAEFVRGSPCIRFGYTPQAHRAYIEIKKGRAYK